MGHPKCMYIYKHTYVVLFLVNDMQPQLSKRVVFFFIQKIAQRSETNEKSIFQFLILRYGRSKFLEYKSKITKEILI